MKKNPCHATILCAALAFAPLVIMAQTNVVLDGTTGTNTDSTTYVTDGGLNLSLGLGVEYLIVGGGGGGGNTFAGGGGAGGLLQGSVMVGADDFAVQVGAGGAAGANGTNSSWNNLTAIGGGAGGGLSGAGSVGGSGGGAGGRANTNGANGTSGQGNKGGNEVAGDFDGGAGGGGAGGVGGNNGTQRGGNGGAGGQSAITGANTFYAAGGGGGGYAGQTAGTGGSGIGGNGATTTPATSGAAGTGSGGGGGGGGGGASFGGASGGSGIVILRYLGGPLATGGTISSGTGSAAGYTLHTFNSTGSSSFDLSSSSLNGRLGATLTGNLIGAGAVTYNGPGTLTLAADNRLYNGTTKITGGTLNISNSYGLGNGAVELLTPGTALTFSTGISNYFLSRGISTAAGTSINLNGTVSITGDNSATTIASDISGGGRLSLSSGLYTLSGSNSFTGGTIINSGRLIALNPAAFSSGPITSTASTAGVSFATSTTLTNDMNWLGFGGDLTVDSGNVVTLAGKINVAQNFLFKAGGGTLEISSTEGNEFGDGITVIEGRLRGTAASLSTLLVNDGEVEFNQTTNGVVTRSIRGTGKLIKTGEGTLSFSPLFGGTTTFTGGTEVQDGRLQVSGASFPGNVNVSSNAVLEFIAGGAFRGVISGAGEVVKTAPGPLGLMGSNTYGGTTIVGTGILQIGDGGTTGTLGTGAVTLSNGATLVFNRADAMTVGNDIAGAGALMKDGAGTTTLSGTNTYSGGTTVSVGRLVGNAASLQGAIANNAMVEFNQSGSGAYAGAMSGTGSLHKTGLGRLELSGTSSYSGATSVEAGELRVNGSIADSAVTVASGASLSGSGAVGAISGAGAINPGNSPGILTAPSVDPSGGLAFNFEFTNLNPVFSDATASVNDLLRLTGSTPFVASLTAGNAVNVYFNVGNFGEGQTYTGAFFTDAAGDFATMIMGGDFNFYVQDAGGSLSYGGQSYSALGGELSIVVSTKNQSADFGAGTIDGQITQFEVVPEPSTYALLILAAAGLGARAWRKRRRAQGL